MTTVHKVLRSLIVLLGVLLVALLLWKGHSQKQSQLKPVLQNVSTGTVSDFSFRTQDNRDFGSKDLVGHYWVADFIFTSCMGPCPLITTRMAEIQQLFQKELRVRFVSFTVDPEHDTPAVLKNYANNYGAKSPQWQFLTGKKEKIYELIRGSFKLAVEDSPAPADGNVANDFVHSTHFVLVDPTLRIVGYYISTDAEARQKLISELTTRLDSK